MDVHFQMVCHVQCATLECKWLKLCALNGCLFGRFIMEEMVLIKSEHEVSYFSLISLQYVYTAVKRIV